MSVNTGDPDLDLGDGDDEPDLVKRLRNRGNKEKDGRIAAETRAEQAERKVAILQAGIGDLTEKKLTALLAAHGDGEMTAEALKATAADLGFTTAAPAPESDDEGDEAGDAADGQQRIAAAGGGSSNVPGVLTAETIASWPMDKRNRFAAKFPAEWDALLGGAESVPGVAFV